MSIAQNLSYAAIQVVHNLGAVVTVGGSLIATRLPDDRVRPKLAQLVLFGWLTQAVSGATFGAVSYYYYQRFPDISGIALIALNIKMSCVTLGILLLVAYLWRNDHWTYQQRHNAWIASSALAITAISGAAFLRWFA